MGLYLRYLVHWYDTVEPFRKLARTVLEVFHLLKGNGTVRVLIVI